MKNINPIGLFDDHFLLNQLTKLGDPLEKLDNFIDWKIFEVPLNQAFEINKKKISKGGRPSFSKVLLFKALIIQSLYNLSDDQLEYQILDRASFKRFLGIKKSDKVPDSKTYWHFRKQLESKCIVRELFNTFNRLLDQAGILAHEGKILDASFVKVPKQRNNRDENQHIKKTGEAPENWNEKPAKKSQKDLDARWTKKNNASYYGYKNHIKIDATTKIVENYVVTDASVHDSQVVPDLLTKSDEGQNLWADSAYRGKNQEDEYKRKKVISNVHEKGSRNNPLTDEQKARNKEKSKTRVRVEHVFGFIENSMKKSYIRTIGIVRAETKIGLINLTYNLCRCVQLKIAVSMG